MCVYLTHLFVTKDEKEEVQAKKEQFKQQQQQKEFYAKNCGANLWPPPNTITNYSIESWKISCTMYIRCSTKTEAPKNHFKHQVQDDWNQIFRPSTNTTTYSSWCRNLLGNGVWVHCTLRFCGVIVVVLKSIWLVSLAGYALIFYLNFSFAIGSAFLPNF